MNQSNNTAHSNIHKELGWSPVEVQPSADAKKEADALRNSGRELRDTGKTQQSPSETIPLQGREMLEIEYTFGLNKSIR